MRMARFLVAGLVSCLLGTTASAQSVDEIVLPAGMFAKDAGGIVYESGGYAGTGVEHGTFRFPPNRGAAVVGITILLPLSWDGKDVDIVFGGQTGAWSSGQYRIVGQANGNTLGQTATLGAEDWGATTEVVMTTSYTVSGRRFTLAIGRDPDHVDDTSGFDMNLEYVALRRH